MFKTLQPISGHAIELKEANTGISPDGFEVSITPDDFQLDIFADRALIDTGSVVCRFPISLDDTTSVAGFLVHVRGTARLSFGSRAWLTAQLAGGSAMLAWPMEKPASPDAERAEINFLASFFAEDMVLDKQTNPLRPEPIPPTLAILAGVERRNETEHALLTIDTIDIMALNFMGGEPDGRGK
jgi:hypothetical protein